MPAAQAGVASAVASTSRQVGMTLGVAVIGAIAGGTLSGAIGPSFTAATHAGWWVSAGLGALCLAVGVLSTSSWANETARQTAEALPRGRAQPQARRVWPARAGARIGPRQADAKSWAREG